MLVGASRRRLEDARTLHGQKRWAGAMYLGGYAIECSLKAYVCFSQAKQDLRDTSLPSGTGGINSHNLSTLIAVVAPIQRAVVLDRTGVYKSAWNTVTSMWRVDSLRYWNQQGYESASATFISSVEILHRFLLEQQGEGR